MGDENERQRLDRIEKQSTEHEAQLRAIKPELLHTLKDYISNQVEQQVTNKIKLMSRAVGLTLTVLAMVVGADFLTRAQVLRTLHQVAFPSIDLWKEMENQVATSFADNFVLGAEQEGKDYKNYRVLPFFAPNEMKGVSLCYLVKHTGSGVGWTIEIQLDDHSKKLTIGPPTVTGGFNARSTDQIIEDCVDNFTDTFGIHAASAGTGRHSIALSIISPNPNANRLEVTAIINVLGKLPAREATALKEGSQ